MVCRPLSDWRSAAAKRGHVGYHHEFAPVAQAVPAARQAVRAICIRHGLDSHDPELVVSELVGNALRHTAVSDFVGVVVRVQGARMVIDVSDPERDRTQFLVHAVVPAETAGSGRGLLLVAAISERVDVVLSARRKAVRAHLVVEHAGHGVS